MPGEYQDLVTSALAITNPGEARGPKGGVGQEVLQSHPRAPFPTVEYR